MFKYIVVFPLTDSYYVTWGARADLQLPPGAPLPPTGKPLGKLKAKDFQSVVEKGVVQFSEFMLAAILT